MVVCHYGSTEIIRQCVTPGMYIEHEGETYIASANKIDAHKLFCQKLHHTKMHYRPYGQSVAGPEWITNDNQTMVIPVLFSI